MNDVIKKVFGSESLDAEEFERRLSSVGSFELVGQSELEAYGGLTQENERLKNELDKTVSENLIERELSRHRVRNIRAARAIIDDGEIFGENGLDSEKLTLAVERMKTDNNWLFEDGEQKPAKLSTGRPQGSSFSRDFTRMSDAEYYKTIKNN